MGGGGGLLTQVVGRWICNPAAQVRFPSTAGCDLALSFSLL